MGGSRPFWKCYTHVYLHLTLSHNSSFDKNIAREGGKAGRGVASYVYAGREIRLPMELIVEAQFAEKDNKPKDTRGMQAEIVRYSGTQ